MGDWFEWWKILIGIGVPAIGRFAWRRRPQARSPGPSDFPGLGTKLRRIVEANIHLFYCEAGSQGKDKIIAELIQVMKNAGIASEEIKRFQALSENSHGTTGSPFGTWPAEENSRAPASKTTPSSSDS